MKPVSGISKVVAGAGALGVTFMLVWNMASLGYRGAVPMSMQLAAATQTASHYR
jgi:hypothetical protein